MQCRKKLLVPPPPPHTHTFRCRLLKGILLLPCLKERKDGRNDSDKEEYIPLPPGKKQQPKHKKGRLLT